MTSSWHILIVDDNEHELLVLSSLLTHYEVKVDQAIDARNALKLLENNTYTAVIIDLTLPDASGWEIMATLKRMGRTANVPCFATTAYHSSKVEKEALNAGFRAYFPKPINVKTFMDDLRQYLN